ncbi:MAG: hypothetical protein FD123_2205 [Bacteroidetes bacterium]|nr:MAG: hypothetical protein FD123_2205 [Bacteroidota bacterium]
MERKDGRYRVSNPESTYFLTLTIKGHCQVFGREKYCSAAIDSLRYCIDEKGLRVYAWVLMPDHLHIIAKAENGNLPSIIRSFKVNTTKHIISGLKHDNEEWEKEMLRIFGFWGKLNPKNENYQVWDSGYYAKECASSGFLIQKIDYIHNNPVRAELAARPEGFLYSSARDYFGGKGILPVVKPFK